MFKYQELTDQEKLLFAEDYISLLKQEIKNKNRRVDHIQQKSNSFLNEFKAYSTRFKKLASYKLELQAAHKKKREAELAFDKSERQNYKYRQRIKELEG
jgi:hypothetical protein